MGKVARYKITIFEYLIVFFGHTIWKLAYSSITHCRQKYFCRVGNTVNITHPLISYHRLITSTKGAPYGGTEWDTNHVVKYMIDADRNF